MESNFLCLRTNIGIMSLLLKLVLLIISDLVEVSNNQIIYNFFFFIVVIFGLFLILLLGQGRDCMVIALIKLRIIVNNV